MPSKPYIVLIEDDIPLAESICAYLTQKNIKIKHVVDEQELIQLLKFDQIQLIISDVNLPGADGFQIAKKYYSSGKIPFLFFSAHTDLDFQLKGYEVGAVDYICKPVDPEILAVKIKNLINLAEPEAKPSVFKYSNLSVDTTNRTVLINDKIVDLSRYDHELLSIFIQNKGKPLSRDELYKLAMGREYDGEDRTIDIRVSRLRRKLDKYKILKCTIRTDWGRGYLLCLKTN